jgi:hypothetical protein
VHVGRDIASLLPAEWQETVKHRNARGWDDWLADVIDRESVSAERRQWWFWRVHDTLAILDLWSRHLSAENVHVITAPPATAGTGLLWERFAGVLGVDPASVDLTRARANTSLGLPEIEFLRRLNEQLPDEVPDWFYMWNVKEALAHQTLAARPADGRLVLPADRYSWADAHADALISGLRKSSYDVVGDLDELLPRVAPKPGARPDEQKAEDLLDVAVDSAFCAQPQAGHGRGGLAARVESTVAASPRLKRTVRELSSRHASVRQLRILAWRALERSRARKHS